MHKNLLLCCNLERVKTLMDGAKQVQPTLPTSSEQPLLLQALGELRTGSGPGSAGLEGKAPSCKARTALWDKLWHSSPLSCPQESTILALNQPLLPCRLPRARDSRTRLDKQR